MHDEPFSIKSSSTNEDNLFRAVLANPWDDSARNAYANWLEEQGSTHHAAVLRATPAQRPSTALMLSDSICADAPCDCTVILSPEGLPGVSIEARSLASKRFEREGPAWLRRHHVGEVLPEGKPRGWPAVFAGPWLAQARGLSFAGRPFAALDALAASPWLPSLASLSFGSETPHSDSLTSFFQQAELRGLCRLSRRGGPFSAAAMRAVAKAPFLQHLRSFDCGHADDAAAALLLRSPEFNGLVSLALMHGGNSGVREVAEARGLAGLRYLDLYRSAFDDDGVAALAGSPLLVRLRRLRLDLLGYETTHAMERLARALPQACSLELGSGAGKHREALAAILGERLMTGDEKGDD